jgi:pentatricopeptide repeat protein
MVFTSSHGIAWTGNVYGLPVEYDIGQWQFVDLPSDKLENAEQMTESERRTSGDCETIGERIYRLRKEKGLSQSALAGPGMSIAHISRIEAGKRQPSMKVIRGIARRLGVSPDFLETGVELTTREDLDLALADVELRIRLDSSDEAVERDLLALLTRAQQEGESDIAARAHATLGMAAVSRGRLNEGIEHLRSAIAYPQTKPDVSPDVYTTLATAYCETGRPDDAVALCEQALAEAHAENGALRTVLATHLSQALSELGEFERAERVLERAAGDIENADPYARARLHWSLARVATMQDDRRLALRHMRQAIALLEGTEDTVRLARAHVMCGYILLWSDTTTGVATHLRVARALLPAHADVADRGLLLALEALLAARQEKYEEAGKAADEALSLLSENGIDRAMALYAKALAVTAAAEYETADRFFDDLLAILVPIKLWREAALVARDYANELRWSGRPYEAQSMKLKAEEYASLATSPKTASDRSSAPRAGRL